VGPLCGPAERNSLSLRGEIKQQRRGFNGIFEVTPGAFAAHFELKDEAHLRRRAVLVGPRGVGLDRSSCSSLGGRTVL
jgi:hypothetical protein